MRKRRFTRNFTSISEENLIHKPSNIIQYFENLPETLFHVVILSYDNLVELNQVTSYLIR